MFSWLRNIWKSGSEPRRDGTFGGEPTVDYPASSSVTLAEGESGPGRLQLRYGVVSTVGSVRDRNEDSYYVPTRGVLVPTPDRGPGRGDSDLADSRPVGPPTLFVVADGMGGQLAGEQASAMAVEHIPRELHHRLGDVEADDEQSTLRAIRESVAYANQEILSLSSLATEFSNMGTTVVLALFRRERIYVAGVGDSRAYRLRNDRIDRLTRDHSLAAALEEAGTIEKEEVENHKYRNVLYLFLGSKDAGSGPEDIRVMDLRIGDRILLATDGLTGSVTDDRLAEVLRSADDPAQAARTLVDEALTGGSKDNITCVIIHVAAP